MLGPMRVLVTGGTGFVGSYVVVALLRAGHDVRVLARRPEQVPATFGPHQVQVDDVVAGDVLDAAVAWGVDPVVHVSSTVVLTRREGSGPDLPLGDLPFPYSRSKIESEVHARRLQALGHPVVIVYPGGVQAAGPGDTRRGPGPCGPGPRAVPRRARRW